MKGPEDKLPSAASPEEEAYAWVVRLSSDQRTSQDEARFEQWLDEDEENAGRFEGGLAFWNALGALKENPEALKTLGHLYSSPQDVPGEQRFAVSRRALIGGGITALAASLAAVAVVPMLGRGPHLYETQKGEQRRVTLDDGSTVVLDTATRISVAMDSAQRLITLEQGQAFFDVAHDPERPFRVFAGRDEIRALGTAFEVRFERGSARVILEEGRVAVFRGGAGKALGPVTAGGTLNARKADVVLEPGQEVKLASTPAAAIAEPPKVATVDLSKTNAWRDGDLVFDDVSLATAVSEVNRYGGREIVLADPSLQQLRISGTFHTNRPEAFVEGVTAALPVRLQESDKEKLVLARG